MEANEDKRVEVWGTMKSEVDRWEREFERLLTADERAFVEEDGYTPCRMLHERLRAAYLAELKKENEAFNSGRVFVPPPLAAIEEKRERKLRTMMGRSAGMLLRHYGYAPVPFGFKLLSRALDGIARSLIVAQRAARVPEQVFDMTARNLLGNFIRAAGDSLGVV